MTWYPPENTNIDRGDSRGQYWYPVADINVISNTSIVNNCFIIQFVFSIDNCGNSIQHQTPLIQKARVNVGVTTGDVSKIWYWLACTRMNATDHMQTKLRPKGPVAFILPWTSEKWNSSLIFTLCFYIVFLNSSWNFGLNLANNRRKKVIIRCVW